MKTSTIIHLIVSYLSGFVSYWLGGYDLLLKTMLTLTVFDFLTGTLTAVYLKNFRASLCSKGIIKKVYMYVTVALAVVVQRYVGDSIPVRETVIVFYIVSEFTSNLENIGKVIEYPPKLKNILGKLNE